MKQLQLLGSIGQRLLKDPNRAKSTLTLLLRIMKETGLTGILRLYKAQQLYQHQTTTGYQNWLKTAKSELDPHIKTLVADSKFQPLISILIPVYNPPVDYFKQAITSVLNQSYPHWELCLANDCSTDPGITDLLDDFEQQDQRINVIHREENGHISQASNSAIEIATGEYFALMDQDDLLPKHALMHVAHSIINNPEARIFYSDEDKIDAHGQRSCPNFKPGWNPFLFLSYNYISHLGVYDAELVKQAGGFKAGLEGAQDYDLAARCIDLIEPDQIHHIPQVLYHWRILPGSTSMGASQKPYVVNAGLQAMNDHAKRHQWPLKVQPSLKYGGHDLCPHPLTASPSISWIMTTLNPNAKGFHAWLKKFRALVPFEQEWLCLTNEDLHTSISEQLGFKIIPTDSISFSESLHRAACKASGDLLCFIHPGLLPMNQSSISEMVHLAMLPKVGAVGPAIWDRKHRMLSGGLTLAGDQLWSMNHAGNPKGNTGFMRRALMTQNLSAVPLDALMIKRERYHQIQGFDPHLKQTWGQDLDLCLQCRDAGYHQVWSPQAEFVATGLIHQQPGPSLLDQNQIQYLNDKWGESLVGDPYQHPWANSQIMNSWLNESLDKALI